MTAGAASAAAIRAVVLTFSDSRTDADDTSGKLLVSLLEAAGHVVVAKRIVREDEATVRQAFDEALASEVDVIVSTGGTGIAPRDIAIDVLERRFDKKLDGFGEAFRRLSWDEVGARSLLSRATAGTVGTTLVAAFPGSEKAVRLGVRDVLLPVLGHAVALLRGHTSHGLEKSDRASLKK